MDYFEKIEQNIYSDLAWNIPDKKQGSVSLIGGNSQNFNNIIKTAEKISDKYPVESVKVFLPDALKSKLPPLENFIFLPSTESGSFSESDQLNEALNMADFNILTGDFSKNSITAKAVSSACVFAEKPTLLTRDTIDCITLDNPERLLMNENIIIFASMPGIQKLLHSVYYPKVILLSQPIMQIAETLHKFTLSYPVSIITLFNEQVLIAKNGAVKAVPLEKTPYTPLTLWMGDFAAKMAIMNLYNPNNFEKATISSLF